MKPGFSMVELLVVIIVLMVLALMSVPMAMSMTPYMRVRVEAQNAAAIMRQARLKAASTQRPTRVVLDCADHASKSANPCQFRMQTASYKDGKLDGWNRVPVGGMQGAHDLSPSVTVRAVNGDTGASVFWIVFMPSSRVFASHSPYELEFVPEQFKASATKGVWKLSVNNSSGRTTLVRK